MNVNRQATYAEVLKLKELLSLQQPKTSKADDRLFIVIHQICELYFSQILVEITALQSKFKEDESAGKVAISCGRIVILINAVCEQFEVLKAIKINDFCDFISNYAGASGAQSFQYHLIEARLGFNKLKALVQKSDITSENLEHGTLREDAIKYIQRNYMRNFCNEHDTRQQGLVDLVVSISRNTADYSDLVNVVECLIDLDEAMNNWQTQHLRIAERMIGQQSIGTGGSIDRSGLYKALNRRLFPEFLEARAKLRERTIGYIQDDSEVELSKYGS